MLSLATHFHLQLGSLFKIKVRTHQNFYSPLCNEINWTEQALFFNLKHSNWFFFPHKLCSTLSVDKENLKRECCFYMQNIHFPFFFFFAFLHYTQGDLEKKGKVSTNTVHYDKSGNGHVFCSFIFTLYNPPLRFGCWVVYKSKNRPLHSTGNIRQFFFRHMKCNESFMPLQKQDKKSAPVNVALFWQLTSNTDACVMHGMHELVVAPRRLFGKYIFSPVMTVLNRSDQ